MQKTTVTISLSTKNTPFRYCITSLIVKFFSKNPLHISKATYFRVLGKFSIPVSKFPCQTSLPTSVSLLLLEYRLARQSARTRRRHVLCVFMFFFHFRYTLLDLLVVTNSCLTSQIIIFIYAALIYLKLIIYYLRRAAIP